MINVNDILKKCRQRWGFIPSGLHIKKDCGTYVVIRRGRVVEVGEPKIKHCPLAAAVRGTDLPSSRCLIREEVGRNIKRYGYFTSRREIRRKHIMVPYGASEMLMAAARKGRLDAAVVVCDGAGSVIATDPYVIQGIGAHMNGLLYTSPLKTVIGRIERSGCMVPFRENAAIRQVEACRVAAKKGHRRIAVTVSDDDLERLEEIPKIEKTYDCEITVLAVCLTGLSETTARRMAPFTHLVWGCASRAVRKIIAPTALLQLGVKIPVFATRRRGVELIAAYSPDDKFLDRLELPRKRYLIFSRDITKKGVRSQVGIFPVYLNEVERLPFAVEDEPSPLW